MHFSSLGVDNRLLYKNYIWCDRIKFMLKQMGVQAEWLVPLVVIDGYAN